MKNYYNKSEVDEVLYKLIEKGYQSACYSFSMILGKNVSLDIDNLVVCFGQSKLKLPEARSTRGQYIMTTNVVGELAGRSFLVLNEEEAQEVFLSTMPLSKLDDGIKKELLREIDNILSAAVITQLSNYLGIKIYGDVPKIEFVQGQEVDNHIFYSGVENTKSIFLIAHSSFIINDRCHLRPCFIWQLDESIINLVRIKCETV